MTIILNGESVDESTLSEVYTKEELLTRLNRFVRNNPIITSIHRKHTIYTVDLTFDTYNRYMDAYPIRYLGRLVGYILTGTNQIVLP